MTQDMSPEEADYKWHRKMWYIEMGILGSLILCSRAFDDHMRGVFIVLMLLMTVAVIAHYFVLLRFRQKWFDSQLQDLSTGQKEGTEVL